MTHRYAMAPVTVVIPCYCCSTTIGRALASVSNQTVLPREVILVEDASPDAGKTRQALSDLVSEYAGLLAVKIIHLNENSGAAGARNAGWAAASQSYIAFLDADDSWHPRKLEIQYEWMRSHPEYYLTGHERPLMGKEASFALPSGALNVGPITKVAALLSNPFPTSSVMLRRDVPARFKHGKRHIEDYLLWLQIILSGMPCAFMKLPLASTYKADYGAGGLSGDLWKMEKGELDTYWQIYRSELIGSPALTVLVVHSFMKYMRRVVIVMMRCMGRRK